MTVTTVRNKCTYLYTMLHNYSKNVGDLQLLILLMAEPSSDIMEVLHREEIAIEGFTTDTIIWELGREVPECWHHRLDQDFNNNFTPMEYVGYNKNSKIVHAVLPPGVENFDSIYHDSRCFSRSTVAKVMRKDWM